MDVFQLREQVIGDYASYMQSFIEIRDRRISEHVQASLPHLWPDPLVQLNPMFEPGVTMDELISDGELHPGCREIFTFERDGLIQPLQLYRHQIEGIRAARRDENYVLTTGTGSGKSLSYIVPIVDHVLRMPEEKRDGVQAIVVYPMNALANSQFGELEKYLGCDQASSPVKFARYTGQDSKDQRQRIRECPPDILLTNYVMLELILTRPEERRLVSGAGGLRFLVFDELHTYRGRQGADVSLLARRVREASGSGRLLHVGTSATMLSEGSWRDQQQVVADVASKVFGAPVKPRWVIGETLRRVSPELDVAEPDVVRQLQERVGRKPPATTPEFIGDPLTSWIESTLGVHTHEQRLIRQKPQDIESVASELSTLVERPSSQCEAAIRETLMEGYRHLYHGRPVFAFRLHQFISKGDAVYASLEPEDQRFLTVVPQRFKPESDEYAILLPLCFCRECGQEFYSVRRVSSEGRATYFAPREVSDQHKTDDGEPGFLYLNSSAPWPREVDGVVQAVPESWLEERRGRLVIRSNRKDRLPRVTTVSPGGTEGDGELEVAYFKAPFVFCPNCGVEYSTRSRSDFGKVGTLGSEGRSTATTILSLATLRRLRAITSLDRKARKLLSFTDNRQDAALQAGHFNDFVNLGLVRSGLCRALQRAGESGIEHNLLTQRVFEALDLPMADYAYNPDVRFRQRERTEKAFRRILGYYLYKDLARGWRLTSPNLEQCGLLSIAYRDLREVCEAGDLWEDTRPELARASPDLREQISNALLNYLRRELAIFIEYLEPTTQEQIRQDAGQLLIPPWAMDQKEKLEQYFLAIPGSRGAHRVRGRDRGRFMYLSARGGIGQYLRRRDVLGAQPLKLTDTQEIIDDLIRVLHQGGQLRESRVSESVVGFQVSAAAMLWRVGDERRAAHDPVRVPQTPAGGLSVNAFFRNFYASDGRDLSRFLACEHTAQVRAELREQREIEFRSAKIPLLFCSPTMELGVDISELNVVNMRNVPPTPANYAQRSGRAGRSGQPAFVFTYCTPRSPHDHYFFRRPESMVAGQVKAPRIELKNEDLVRAHVHAIWLAASGKKLGDSLAHLLEIGGEGRPTLAPKPEILEILHNPGVREKAFELAKRALGPVVCDLVESGPAQADAWIRDVLKAIPQRFEAACERWRGLYFAAYDQAAEQQRIANDRSRLPRERQAARQLRGEAEKQLDLLVEQSDKFRSDFYPYRYFASEGFLPGYNFPRLPLSAYLPRARGTHSEEEFLSRPRFLAVSEFGPRSIIYHEGARYSVRRVILGGGVDGAVSDEGMMTRACHCNACGLIEPVTGDVPPDLCSGCHAELGPPTSNYFRMRNVTTRRKDRITSDEEERLRIGYELRTAVHFPEVEGRPRQRGANVINAEGETIARFVYGHGATVWRINRGWRRRSEDEPDGFQLDFEQGAWVTRNPEDPDDDGDDVGSRVRRVIPFVQDTRNCLLIEPTRTLPTEVVASLQAALKTAIQVEYQLEDRELAVEPLPSADERRRILFYEAAEGGAGVLRQLLDEPGDLAKVVDRALSICHYDPKTGEDVATGRDRCVAACYDCLLSYYNQLDHQLVHRKYVLEQLRGWQGARVESSPEVAPRQNLFSRLRAACESELEKRFLAFLQTHGYRLPNQAQVYLASGNTRVDFLYRSDNGGTTAIFVDGPHHDTQDVARRDLEIEEMLEDAGVMVVRFHHAGDWKATATRFPSVFGRAEPSDWTPEERGNRVDVLDSCSDRSRPSSADFLATYFDEHWHPLLQTLIEHEQITVEVGGELGARVEASYLARVECRGACVYLIDSDDKFAQRALELLAEDGQTGLVVEPGDSDIVRKVLDEIGGGR